MVPSIEQSSADKRRRANDLRALPPFHLQLPDVTPEKKKTPKPAPAATQPQPSARPIGIDDPVGRARARISKKRYNDGRQQVSNLLDHMRDRRRKIFGRLWVASVILTALSVVALAIELIQGLGLTATTAESISAPAESESKRPVVRKPSPRAPRPIIQAEAHATWSESPGEAPRERPVKSALYTTEGSGRPKGVWLDGSISDNDDDSDELNH